MKYKNIRYDETRKRIPLNIQFFAEPAPGGDGAAGTEPGQGEEGGEKTPNVDELLAELARERATNAQNKAALDKALKEKGELTKSLRAKMSAEEQEAEAKRIADEEKDAEIQELKEKFRNMDYTKRYMSIGMEEKDAEELSVLTGELADPDIFFSTLGKLVQGISKKAEEEAVQKLLRDRPEIHAGSGDSDKNALAKAKAKEAAARTSGADANILKYYM